MTKQEALEAMAGRSPDGKPLIFVSQQDHDALRKKYDSLLEMTKRSKRVWRQRPGSWGRSQGIAVVIAVAYHPDASAQVEPFGQGYYTSNNVAGVHAANAFCATRKEQRGMKPVDAQENNGLLFKCIMSAEEQAADEQRPLRSSILKHRLRVAPLAIRAISPSCRWMPLLTRHTNR